MNEVITVSWFSAGVSSAVATKLVIDQVDHIIYQHIDDMESDTLRFVRDCEQWFGKPVEIQQSPFRTVESVCLSVNFVRGPHGAPCTGKLKKELRHQWESEHRLFNSFRYVWGMDCSKREQERAKEIREAMFESEHLFPLIDRGITKEMAHGILKAAGIKRPRMYDLGYRNNNCVGCVKGGMGYWNMVRVTHPDVFVRRAKMERIIGGTIIKGVYLDELDPDAGRNEGPVVEECGAMCETGEAVLARVETEGQKGPNAEAHASARSEAEGR